MVWWQKQQIKHLSKIINNSVHLLPLLRQLRPSRLVRWPPTFPFPESVWKRSMRRRRIWPEMTGKQEKEESLPDIRPLIGVWRIFFKLTFWDFYKYYFFENGFVVFTIWLNSLQDRTKLRSSKSEVSRVKMWIFDSSKLSIE